MNRHDRLELLRDLIASDSFASQHALIDALATKHVEVDQSTLSRDLTEIGARKTDGRYRLETGLRAAAPGWDASAAVRGWQACGAHLIVVRTRIGQAQAVGVAVDRAGEPAVAGTLAGDDTVFLATTSRSKQAIVLRRLKQWFGERP